MKTAGPAIVAPPPSAPKLDPTKGWWNTPETCIDCKTTLDAERQKANFGNYPLCVSCKEKRKPPAKAPRKARTKKVGS